MLRYTVHSDQNGFTDVGVISVSDQINALSLAANTAKSDTIPSTAKFVSIVSSTTCYVRFGAVATIPGDTTDGSAAELMPAGVGIFRATERPTTVGSIITGTALLTVDSTDGITKANPITVAGAGSAGADLVTTVSSINQSTKVVTLGGNASTTVTRVLVSLPFGTISAISGSTCVLTLSYFR